MSGEYNVQDYQYIQYPWTLLTCALVTDLYQRTTIFRFV